MGKIYDNKIPTQLGFKYTERVVADDRTEVQSLEDLKTLVVPPYFVTFVRDVLDENGLPTPFCWNGNDQTDLNNWVNPLEILKLRTTNLENETNALTSGVRYNIPQAGNTPANEPAPTQDGIYRVKTINATYTNFGGIVVPNDAGFIYDIQVSGIGTTPVYTLLSTDLNLDIDTTVIEDSPNPVSGGTMFSALAGKVDTSLVNTTDTPDNTSTDLFPAGKILDVVDEKIKQPTIDYIAFSNYTTADKNLIDVSDTTKTYVVFDTDLGRLENYKNGAWRAVSDEEALALKADKTDIIKINTEAPVKSIGINLLNPNDNYVVESSFLGFTGSINTSTNYAVSGYIKVKTGDNIHYSSPIGGAFNVLYDNNLNFISGTQSNPIVASQDGYVRLSISCTDGLSSNWESLLRTANKGNSLLSFEPYTDTKDFEDLSNTLSGNLSSKANLIIGKNLFDKNAVTVGYISSTSGDMISTNPDYETSDFIPIEELEDYVSNQAIRFSCFFEEDKKTVVTGGWTSNTDSFTVPANAKFIRISIYTSSFVDINTFQLEKGNVSTNYDSFGYKINPLEIRDKTISGSKLETLSIKNDNINYGEIERSKTDFFEKSKNLFDYQDSDIIRGGFLAGSGLVSLINSAYSVTGFIPCKPNTNYQNNNKSSSGGTYNAYFDKNKEVISTSLTLDPILTPSNCAYFRVTLAVNSTDDANLQLTQIEEGATATEFVPYSNTLKEDALPENLRGFDPDNLPSAVNVVDELYTNNLLRTPANLFDTNDSDYIESFYLIGGTFYSSASYDVSGYIPITDGNILTSHYTYGRTVRFVCFYDENKNYIPDVDLENVQDFTRPNSDAVYMRVSVSKSNVNITFIEIAPTRSKIFSQPSDELVPSSKYSGYIDAFLPPKIYVGLGSVVEIYNNQVALFINENDFVFRWEAFTSSKSIGVNYKKKFVIDTTSESSTLVDTYTLVLTIYDKYLRVVKTVESILVVADMTIDIVTPLNILPMGDSLLNKPYLHKTRDLLAAKFGKNVLNWIGSRNYTHGTSQDKIDIKHEGFSGWRSEQFVNDAGIYQNRNLKLTVSGITTPPAPKKIYTFTLEDASTQTYEVEDLFNENNEIFTGANGTLTYITFNALDTLTSDPVGAISGGTITETNSGDVGDSTITFSKYTDIGGNPFWNNSTDAVDFPNYLSQNSLPTPDAIMTMLGTNNKSDYQSTIDLINIAQTQLTDIPVFVIIPQYTGLYLQDIGVRKMWHEHIIGLVNGLKDNPNVYFIPIAQTHDSEHNCFNGFTTINPYNSFVTEKVYTASDFVHPQSWGYTQFAHTIYGTILAEYENI